MPVHLEEKLTQSHPGLGRHIVVAGAEYTGPNVECSAIGGHGLVKFPFRLEEDGQVMQGSGGIRVFHGSVHFCLDGEGTFKAFTRPPEISLAKQDNRKQMKNSSDTGMFRGSVHTLQNGKGMLEPSTRAIKISLLLQHSR